jgi:hypothetical protein
MTHALSMISAGSYHQVRVNVWLDRAVGSVALRLVDVGEARSAADESADRLFGLLDATQRLAAPPVTSPTG